MTRAALPTYERSVFVPDKWREYRRRWAKAHPDRIRAYKRKYRATAHAKAVQRAYDQRPYVRAKKAAYQKRWRRTGTGRSYHRARQLAWYHTSAGKAYARAYRRRWKRTPAGRLALARYNATRRHRLSINNRHHRDRAGQPSDVTPELLDKLREAASLCPLCGVLMDVPYPASNCPTVDHIVPIAVGGLHMLANLRIICMSCNSARSKDGSDVFGPPLRT